MNLKQLLARVHWPERWPRWPRQSVYPIVGIVLALGMSAGLLVLQSSVTRTAPTAGWILRELQAHPLMYAYLLLATMLMMVLLGWMVGRKEDLLERMTVTDPLTGLANRRRLRAQFNEEINRGARYGTPLALLLIDLDRLKTINDEHGHAAGDRALQLVADSIQRSCRATDLAARHGGDEFVVLAVNTSAVEALALAHRIRANVRRLSVTKRDKKHRLSVSIGAADLERADKPDFDALHAAADEALYRAKADGRDRAVIAPPHFRSGARLKLIQPQPSGHGGGEGGGIPDCGVIPKGVSKSARAPVELLPPLDPGDKRW
jgi:diguanylate cyclase (GGDEF)-like protein